MKTIFTTNHKLVALCMSLFFASGIGTVSAAKPSEVLSEKAAAIKSITDMKLADVLVKDGATIKLNQTLDTLYQGNIAADNSSKKAMLKLIGLKTLFGALYHVIANFNYSVSKDAATIGQEVIASVKTSMNITTDGDHNLILFGQPIISEAELQKVLAPLWGLMENVIRMTSELTKIKQIMCVNNCEAAFKTAKLIEFESTLHSIAEFADLIETKKEEILKLLEQTADKYISAAAAEVVIAEENAKAVKANKGGWGMGVLSALRSGLTALVQ